MEKGELSIGNMDNNAAITVIKGSPADEDAEKGPKKMLRIPRLNFPLGSQNGNANVNTKMETHNDDSQGADHDYTNMEQEIIRRRREREIRNTDDFAFLRPYDGKLKKVKIAQSSAKSQNSTIAPYYQKTHVGGYVRREGMNEASRRFRARRKEEFIRRGQMVEQLTAEIQYLRKLLASKSNKNNGESSNTTSRAVSDLKVIIGHLQQTVTRLEKKLELRERELKHKDAEIKELERSNKVLTSIVAKQKDV